VNQRIEEGKRLLNALGRHSDIIMHAYIQGSVDERAFPGQSLDQLVRLGVLWRPGHKQALRLKGVVRNLLEGSLQDERNRVMSGNVSAALQGLKTLAEHYKESHSAQRFAEAQSYLSELTEHVYQLSESLGNNIRVLFSRINDEFGYVASVEAKIRENQLAQEQVSELLHQLECFRFDQLSEVAGNHSELRHLLVVTLQQRFAKAAQELSVVQARLLALLGRFREFQGRTRLLKGFMLHLEQQPDFAPRNYASMTNLPALFNQSNPVLAPAAADITNSEHENVLAIIAASVSDKQLRQPQRTVPQKAVALSVDAQEAITLSSSKLQKAVEKLFESVIDSGELTSALEFYEKQQLEFDTEAWLYQVIGEYDALDIRDKEFVALEWEGRPDPVFTGNYYIEDIKLGLR
jgi:hypothetical protein